MKTVVVYGVVTSYFELLVQVPSGKDLDQLLSELEANHYPAIVTAADANANSTGVQFDGVDELSSWAAEYGEAPGATQIRLSDGEVIPFDLHAALLP